MPKKKRVYSTTPNIHALHSQIYCYCHPMISRYFHFHFVFFFFLSFLTCLSFPFFVYLCEKTSTLTPSQIAGPHVSSALCSFSFSFWFFFGNGRKIMLNYHKYINIRLGRIFFYITRSETFKLCVHVLCFCLLHSIISLPLVILFFVFFFSSFGFGGCSFPFLFGGLVFSSGYK